MARKAAKVTPETSIGGEVFTGEADLSVDPGTEAPAAGTGWAWVGKVWAAIKPGVPTVYASVITAIISALSVWGGTFLQDYRGASEASSKVAAALKEAGDKDIRVAAANEMNVMAIDAMVKSCAVTFANVLKEQAAAKRAGRNLNY